MLGDKFVWHEAVILSFAIFFLPTLSSIEANGAFHFSELTGQTIPVLSKLSSQICQILDSMHEGDSVSAKTLGKSIFHSQNDWSGYGSAGLFWLLESALRASNWQF